MVSFRISWTDPHARLFDISIRFTAPGDVPRLLLPAWRPGRYLLQNYAANVREWGGSHRVWKDGKSSWRVDARAGEEVEVRYRYYAGVLDAGSSFLDDDEAYVNGSNLFMLVEGLRGEEHRLTVDTDWPIECQLPGLVARDYDHLIDSPFIASPRMTRHSFEVTVGAPASSPAGSAASPPPTLGAGTAPGQPAGRGRSEEGATFHLVFRGDEGMDTAQFIEPMRAIARSQGSLFGGFPFREYRFLIHVGDKWHGVEHEDSCSMIIKRADDGTDHALAIMSHELFHVWNVKRIVPARFTPYDYWNETPTRLLWVMEGLTSYYGELSMLRSGVWSEARYLQHLQKEIETLEAMPARLHLSLSQASFDGWLANPAHQHDLGNAAFSFYNKGEIVSALLDLTIRRATEGAKSLDDVVRLMWEEYGVTRRGLEEDGFERLVHRVADVGDFFARYVDGVEPLPYEELFAAAGVAFASALRGDAPSLAAKLKMDNGLLLAAEVVRGGAGMAAGLLPGDEIVSLNGMRTTTEAGLQTALRSMGESGELVIARGGVLKRLTLRAQADPRPEIRLRIESDNALRREWLRRNG